MKKLFLPALLALFVCVASCKKEDPDVEVKTRACDCTVKSSTTNKEYTSTIEVESNKDEAKGKCELKAMEAYSSDHSATCTVK